jgi:hypothetical protein
MLVPTFSALAITVTIGLRPRPLGMKLEIRYENILGVMQTAEAIDDGGRGIVAHPAITHLMVAYEREYCGFT